MTGFSAEERIDNWLLTPGSTVTVTTPYFCVRDIPGVGGRVGIVNMSTIHDLSLAGVKKSSPVYSFTGEL